MLKHEVGLLNI